MIKEYLLFNDDTHTYMYEKFTFHMYILELNIHLLNYSRQYTVHDSCPYRPMPVLSACALYNVYTVRYLPYSSSVRLSAVNLINHLFKITTANQHSHLSFYASRWYRCIVSVRVQVNSFLIEC